VIPIPGGARVWIATGRTDMRKGMSSLAMQIQRGFDRNPHAGDLYVFRRPARRSFEDFVARRDRDVALRQAVGARSVHVADDD